MINCLCKILIQFLFALQTFSQELDSNSCFTKVFMYLTFPWAVEEKYKSQEEACKKLGEDAEKAGEEEQKKMMEEAANCK